MSKVMLFNKQYCKLTINILKNTFVLTLKTYFFKTPSILISKIRFKKTCKQFIVVFGT